MEVVILVMVTVWIMCIVLFVAIEWLKACWNDAGCMVMVEYGKKFFFHVYKIYTALSKKFKNY